MEIVKITMKKTETLSFKKKKRIQMENIILSEINHSQNGKCLVWNTKSNV